jgi:hypothetical protein
MRTSTTDDTNTPGLRKKFIKVEMMKNLIDTPKMPVKNNGVSNYLVYRGFRGWETHFAALPNE